MRLRLPAALVRGGDPQQAAAPRVTTTDGADEANGEAEVMAVQPRIVRIDPLRNWGKRFAARVRQLRKRWRWLPGWTFAAVTQAPALLAMAWLVPGAGMLLAGRLQPVPMVIIFVPLAIALCYFAFRRLPVRWPGPGPGAARAGRGVSAAALVTMVAVAAAFGVWQALLGSEQVFTNGEPGVYLQYGYWIAEHGTTHIPASAAAFGAAPRLEFATTGFTVSGGTITPSFLPGLPLVLAGGTWLGGLGGALLMPAVIGGCALLSFGGLVGRLCGAWWAVVGELVLGVCLPEVLASRTPFSDPLVQLLLFGGLCLFVDSLVVRRGLHVARGRSSGLVLAGFGGLALGLTVLASIGSLGTLLPVFPVLAIMFVARRPQAGPFGAGFFIGIGLGLATGLVLARPYLTSVSPQLHLIGWCAAGFGALTALVAPFAFPGVRERLRRLCAFRPKIMSFKGDQLALPSLGTLLAGLAVALPVLVLAGLAVRPTVATVRGQTDPAMIRAVAALQRLEGLPVDGTRQYYESSLYWVLWYLGGPAVLLACAGVAVLGRGSLRAALAERATTATASLRLWALPLLIIGWSVVTVLWDPAVVPWQPLASHRLVPVVLPGLLLLAIWMSSRLASRASLVGASRASVALVAVCCVLALAIPPLVTTLNPTTTSKPSVGRFSSGVSKLISRVHLRGAGASATYGGSLSTVSALCAAIGPSASVLFTDSSMATTFAPVVRGICDQPAASVGTAASGGPSASGAPGASAGLLEQAVTAITQNGRHPVLLGPTRASVSLPGVTPRQVISLRTTRDAEVLTGAPSSNWPVTYTLWLAIPANSAT